MSNRLETKPTPDPWRGRQPRYEKLVAERGGRYVLTTRLPSGQPVRNPLGRRPRADPERRNGAPSCG